MARKPRNTDATPDSPLRIIGGRLRGSRLKYSGDPRTRPMKDRVREAVFNLLGPAIKGTHGIDLFAGTGALALEAISRGSLSSTAIERHFPSAKIIQENARNLDLSDAVDVYAGDTFFWSRDISKLPTDKPWVIFCCPPYAMYEEREGDLLDLLTKLINAAPPASSCIVEADHRFDFTHLPQPDDWDVRSYSPAEVGMLVK
ncbi:MAG: RsmD family RNA methyltransferase [Planctomycetota bacterium]